MIEDYSWPRSAAGAAGERTDRSQRKRDPVTQADDNKSAPQQQHGDGQTDTNNQQQQGTPPRITDWASI